MIINHTHKISRKSIIMSINTHMDTIVDAHTHTKTPRHTNKIVPYIINHYIHKNAYVYTIGEDS